MSERMTGERLARIFTGRILSSEKGELFDEIQRARASEAEKDTVIKALADALEAAKIAMHRGEFGQKGRDRDVPAQVDAALRLAGRM